MFISNTDNYSQEDEAIITLLSDNELFNKCVLLIRESLYIPPYGILYPDADSSINEEDLSKLYKANFRNLRKRVYKTEMLKMLLSVYANFIIYAFNLSKRWVVSLEAAILTNIIPPPKPLIIIREETESVLKAGKYESYTDTTLSKLIIEVNESISHSKLISLLSQPNYKNELSTSLKKLPNLKNKINFSLLKNIDIKSKIYNYRLKNKSLNDIALTINEENKNVSFTLDRTSTQIYLKRYKTVLNKLPTENDIILNLVKTFKNNGSNKDAIIADMRKMNKEVYNRHKV